jgi:hypothetical protein
VPRITFIQPSVCLSIIGCCLVWFHGGSAFFVRRLLACSEPPCYFTDFSRRFLHWSSNILSAFQDPHCQVVYFEQFIAGYFTSRRTSPLERNGRSSRRFGRARAATPSIHLAGVGF